MRNRGIGLLHVILVSSVLAGIITLYPKLIEQNLRIHSRSWDTYRLELLAETSFAILESALERRMWEMPPDADCLKDTDILTQIEIPFKDSLSDESVLNVSIKGKYLPETNTLVMETLAQKGRVKAGYLKYFKFSDVNDYLVVSKSTGLYKVGAAYYSPGRAPTLIAGGKRVSIDGKVYIPSTFDGMVEEATSSDPWTGPRSFSEVHQAKKLTDIGTIIQGDRLIFRQGMRYSHRDFVSPGPSSNINTLFTKGCSADNILAPFMPECPTSDLYGLTYVDRNKVYTNAGSGYAILMDDYQQARHLEKELLEQKNISSPYQLPWNGEASIRTRALPHRFFGGNSSSPQRAKDGEDNGDYLSATIDEPIYNLRIPSGSTTIRNFSCYYVNDGNEESLCSDTKDWPVGYNAWKEDANLKGVLFTDELPELKTTKVSWEHFEALKEDAMACGRVYADYEADTVVDCMPSDLHALRTYRDNPTASEDLLCRKMQNVNLENIVFKEGIDVTKYQGKHKNLFLRRVIYGQVPLRVEQTDPNGLALSGSSGLQDKLIRRNIGLWIVNESFSTFKPYAPAVGTGIGQDPGPLFTDFDRKRHSVFNRHYDLTNNDPDWLGDHLPLNLVHLSPEMVHLVSPYHKRKSLDAFKKMFDKDWNGTTTSRTPGDPLRPLHDIKIDRDQEDDAFRFGFRDVFVENVTVIDKSTKEYYAHPSFYTRGLWQPRRDGGKLMNNLSGYMHFMKTSAGVTQWANGNETKVCPRPNPSDPERQTKADFDAPVPDINGNMRTSKDYCFKYRRDPNFHKVLKTWYGYGQAELDETNASGLTLLPEFSSLYWRRYDNPSGDVNGTYGDSLFANGAKGKAPNHPSNYYRMANAEQYVFFGYGKSLSFMPKVFRDQDYHNDWLSSSVYHTGGKLTLDFADDVPPGKWDLSENRLIFKDFIAYSKQGAPNSNHVYFRHTNQSDLFDGKPLLSLSHYGVSFTCNPWENGTVSDVFNQIDCLTTSYKEVEKGTPLMLIHNKPLTPPADPHASLQLPSSEERYFHISLNMNAEDYIHSAYVHPDNEDAPSIGGMSSQQTQLLKISVR